jgi:hypothetical protein
VKTHSGDCTIYAAMENRNSTDGICTCGYGLQRLREGDCSELLSKERHKPEQKDLYARRYAVCKTLEGLARLVRDDIETMLTINNACAKIEETVPMDFQEE